MNEGCSVCALTFLCSFYPVPEVLFVPQPSIDPARALDLWLSKTASRRLSLAVP